MEFLTLMLFQPTGLILQAVETSNTQPNSTQVRSDNLAQLPPIIQHNYHHLSKTTDTSYPAQLPPPLLQLTPPLLCNLSCKLPTLILYFSHHLPAQLPTHILHNSQHLYFATYTIYTAQLTPLILHNSQHLSCTTPITYPAQLPSTILHSSQHLSCTTPITYPAQLTPPILHNLFGPN